MALESELVVAGQIEPTRLLERAGQRGLAGAPVQRLGNGTLIVDLMAQTGFLLSVHGAAHAYVEAASGGSVWVWEPSPCVRLGFRFDKEFDPSVSRAAMLHMVAQIVASGSEDLALTLNGDVLLLRRVQGRLERCQAGFWETVAGELARELADAPFSC
jgi:hypothetical protein